MRSEVQLLLGPPSATATWLGALAQLGEHLLCKQGVIGSIPIGSTRHYSSVMETRNSSLSALLMDWCAGFACIFDIVNGFLIDAVAHGFSGLRTGIVCGTQMIIWLRLSSAPRSGGKRYAGLSLMVWILKREVRAFGGCLGMYRR